jgi:hypothetical protein
VPFVGIFHILTSRTMQSNRGTTLVVKRCMCRLFSSVAEQYKRNDALLSIELKNNWQIDARLLSRITTGVLNTQRWKFHFSDDVLNWQASPRNKGTHYDQFCTILGDQLTGFSSSYGVSYVRLRTGANKY